MIKKIGLGCGGLFALLIVIGIIGGANRTETPGATATPAAAVDAPPAAATPTRAPTAPPAPTPFNFGSGTKRVGTDIPAGTYRLRQAPTACYWARLKGFGGTVGDIAANNNTSAFEVVTILPTDAGFQSERCGTWSADLSAVTRGPNEPFGAGAYIVGVDIAPGTWRASPGGQPCYWARLSNFEGGVGGIVANNNTTSDAVVNIAPTDKGFRSERCGNWTKIG